MTNPFALDNPAPATAQQAPPTSAPASAAVPASHQQFPAGPPTQPSTTASASMQMPADDPFANSDPAPQAPRSPRFRELYGRLIILVPKKLETGLVSGKFKNNDGSPVTQDRMTADLIVLDGGTIHYGGRPEDIPSVPHDKVAEPPCKWSDVFISYAGIISQCRVKLSERAQGKTGMVIGRLGKGEDSGKGNAPWLLYPANDEDKGKGRVYLANQDPFA